MKKADMTKLRPVLLQIVKKNRNRDEHGYALGVLEGGNDNFYEFDIDHDGLPDVIYAGTRGDSKEVCTIIWHGQKGGGYSEDYNIELSLLLSISDSVVHKAVSAYCGTRDILADDFILQNVERTRDDIYLMQDSSFTILRGLIQTDNLISPTKFISVAKEMFIRESPEKIETYNEQASKQNKMAVFGNIIFRFLQGVKGSIIGRKTDAVGVTWFFVNLNMGSRELCTYALHDVDAGWLLAKDVKILH
jgi:hypothetical protein